MLSFEDLFSADEDELLEEMEACLELEDQEQAKQQADEILVAALVLAVNEALQRNTAAELINLYRELYAEKT